jgi:hypothetical protein
MGDTWSLTSDSPSFRHAVVGVAVERRDRPRSGWCHQPVQASGMLDQHSWVQGAASQLL